MSGKGFMARRSVLLAAGAGGLAIAGPGALTAASADERNRPVPAFGVATVADLLVLRTAGQAPGTAVEVLGYLSPGDGGGQLVRWDPASQAVANGGTVFKPAAGTGRWLAVHDGVTDFRKFGIFGATVTADAALEAMVNDPAIHRIEAHTDLQFAKRHVFHRSFLDLDFGGHTVVTYAIEPTGPDEPFAAVMFFQGTLSGTVVTRALAEPAPELRDVFEVGDSSKFEVGSWWTAVSDQASWDTPKPGRDQRELQKFVQVTEIVDDSHIRVNYLNGWHLAAGRVVTWTKVEPVQHVNVRNLVFRGKKVAPDQPALGSNPFAFEFAVHCNASNIHGTATFWPLVMRRYNTHYRTEQCTLANPSSVTWGGAGYLTQQIYCLYGHVSDCHVSNSRHLNDFTGSAYCYVTNCHGDGDDQGPFVTHGQYEHDLVYTGNSGLMTFANSGAQWGGRAKRITVRKHICSWFVARVKITDLTLEDVRVIGKPGLAGSGMLWVNADGVQLRGCQASDTLIISQTTTDSARPNVIEGSVFAFTAAATEIVQASTITPVHFDRTTLLNLDGHKFSGTGALTFTGCTLRGSSPGAAPLTVAATDLAVRSGETVNTGFVLGAATDQRVELGSGARLGGTNSAKALLSRVVGAGTVRWELGDYASSTADTATAHLALTGGTNTYRAVGARFTGGRLLLAAAAFGGTSYLQHTACVEEGVERTELPPDSPRISIAGNLTI
ncbi:hypothetical protein JOF29_001606 [Kribbella aluminosa]|uniref:Peptidase C14 n=1 Tax=Kribbella aluminosa TaxID=416017 RepID=A0ABS4UFY9_9ACTN|nr:hypothetical protein [Kribbella aluminosa]MBP2350523.1 hypothetical protein [Kribbella aluminosa]